LISQISGHALLAGWKGAVLINCTTRWVINERWYTTAALPLNFAPIKAGPLPPSRSWGKVFLEWDLTPLQT
jgi:hypothetical protein